MSVLLDRISQLFEQNRRAYLTLNALYFGLMIIMMIYLNFDVVMRDGFVEKYSDSFFRHSPITLAGQPFALDKTLQMLMNNFIFNLMGSSYGEITLPSLFIPFIGIPIGLYRAIFIGLAFAPSNPLATPIFLPHLPTLVLEGQAAVFAMLGAYIHGRAVIWPESIGQTSRWRAFVEGVRQSGMVYLPIALVLLASAIYGLLEVVILSTR